MRIAVTDAITGQVQNVAWGEEMNVLYKEFGFIPNENMRHRDEDYLLVVENRFGKLVRLRYEQVRIIDGALDDVPFFHEKHIDDLNDEVIKAAQNIVGFVSHADSNVAEVHFRLVVNEIQKLIGAIAKPTLSKG